MIKTLKQLNLKSKKILMRVDFNVPLDGGVVQDTFRIRCAVPTIKYCLKEGASVKLSWIAKLFKLSSISLFWCLII